MSAKSIAAFAELRARRAAPTQPPPPPREEIRHINLRIAAKRAVAARLAAEIAELELVVHRMEGAA